MSAIIFIHVALLTICYPLHAVGFQFTIPTFSSNEWQVHDLAIRNLLRPVHSGLSCGDVRPAEAADQFTDVLKSYLSDNKEFVKEQSSKGYISHEPKTLSQARKKKNALRKKAFSRQGTPEDKRLFRQAVKAVSFLNKQKRRADANKSQVHHEKQYRSNFWGYAKNITQGTYGQQGPVPTFDKDVADTYFPNRYSSIQETLDLNNINWFPYIRVPNGPDESVYDMSPIKPKDIKIILKQKKATSAPGTDGLLYGLLKNLPSTHHFMATLFTNILLNDPNPPKSWSESKVVLIHKKGDTNQPENFRMISLTSCVSKIFHQVLADRTGTFLTRNRFINPDIQKAFLKGINGCVEHNQLLQEAIAFAKSKKKTVHVTFFDLADAFGSISHTLISHSMKRFMLPVNTIQYVEMLYSRLNGSVCGPGWTSNNFKFRRGTFQGDPLSPIIFLMCFNPILEYLENIRNVHGFNLDGDRVITTPYADDFNLITSNKVQHQKIINDLHSKTQSMGLTLKPSKCRSLSICGGVPKVVDYHVGGTRIIPVKEDPQRFLGALITHSGNQKEIYDMIHSKFESSIANIESAPIRNEFKVAIYSRYCLPSMRFCLTVHELSKSNLTLLDRMSDQFIKKWLGVPKYGANTALVHMNNGLDIPRISDIYYVSHCLAYSRTRCKGDPITNKALDSKLLRESTWTKKSSTVVLANTVHGASIGTEQPLLWKNTKSKVKSTLKNDASSYWKSVIGTAYCSG